MQFQTQMKIVGAKCSKGVLDNGQGYDSTTLFVEVPLDGSKGTACGFCTSEFRWGTSDNFKLIEAQKLPITVSATLEIVTSGKLQKTQLVNIKLTDKAA
ncbi:hypothetical protein [Paraperlucidibaca sp.]|uniref:hypothetical protein n=1 Tax=Paraperlucidibaca sp. TaxID=2708021 RepID=UPI0030F44A2A